MNTGRLVPPIVELGLYDYPDDPVAEMRAAGTQVFSFDASQIAQELGDIRLGNTVMLGAISDHLPFPAEVLERCILKRLHARKPNSSNSTDGPSPPAVPPPKRRRKPRRALPDLR
jgi:indolepyruvate ferredoxin oxidoreductase beta subunit